ncbi:MAG: hypothetical protein N2652_09850 [Kiritimatiellae bacterium]|nr:hypothetical protein [Kiritimatiellia bacterium]
MTDRRVQRHRPVRRPIVVASMLMAKLLTTNAAAPSGWVVSAATHRVRVEIVQPPSKPEAGVVAIIPDGGVLPAPAVRVDARDRNGRPLGAGVIWHNPREGLGIVFEAPTDAAGPVELYLQSVPKAESFSAAVRHLKPSLLMYTAAAGASPTLNDAEAIGRETPAGRRSRMAVVPILGQAENRLGPDDHYVSWYTGWLDIQTPGRYQLCSVFDEACEVRLNGRSIIKVSGRHVRRESAKGEYGEWVHLDRGLHSIEYLHYEIDGPQEAHLCWRAPGASDAALPVTIPAGAWLRSGAARLLEGTLRDGTPLALWEAEPAAYVWTAEKPLNIFRFRAVAPAPLPADLAVEWTFDGRSTVALAAPLWFWEDEEPHKVTLRVSRGRAVSTASREVQLPWYPRRLSMNEAEDRQLVRDAFETRLLAGPADRRPCADWSANMWSTLFDALELYAPTRVPELILTRSRADLQRQPPERRWRVEDLYVESVRRTNAVAALGWMEQAAREETHSARRIHWMVERVRVLAFDLGRLDEARALAREAAALPLEGELAVRVAVAAGDVERLALNRDAAARAYAAAQDRYRALQKTAAQLATVRREADAHRSLAARLGGDWRTAAVREGQNLVTVDNLIRQAAWDEAYAVLRQWELEFPLSRLDGDQPLAEAAFWIAVGDTTRALRILRTYRQLVDMNSQLARAMEMERQCLIRLDRRAELDELAKEIERRFSSAGGGGGPRRREMAR